MKKDWLSSLIKARQSAVRSETMGDSVAAFAPFLRAVLGKAKTESFTAQLMADALFKLLSAKKDEMAECTLAEITEETPAKSGTLDRVSDDCLKHALGFLSVSDRVLAVERSCRRLFDLSRAAVLSTDAWDLGYGSGYYSPEWFSSINEMLRVARRCRPQMLWFCDPTTFDSSDEKPAVALMRTLRPTISHLCVSDFVFRTAETWRFNALEEITFFGSRGNLPQLDSFLSRHPRVTYLMLHSVYDSYIGPLIFEVLEKHKQLRYVELEHDFDTYIAPKQAFDMSHIKQLQINNLSGDADPFRCIRPLLHKGLEELRLDILTSNVEPPEFDMYLPSLTQLTLHLKADAIPGFFQKLRADNLKTLKIDCRGDPQLAEMKHYPAVDELLFIGLKS